MVRFRQTLWGLAIVLSVTLVGWILAAYGAPLWCWLGTVLVLWHLSSEGHSAIPVALAWSNALLWISSYIYANPICFEWKNGQHWGLSMLGLWIGSLTVTLLVAKIPAIYDRKVFQRLRPWIAKLLFIVSALGLGIVLYHMGPPPQSQ